MTASHALSVKVRLHLISISTRQLTESKPLFLSTLNRLPPVQDIALQIVHELGLKTTRAEFALSPLSFTSSRKIIITPCNYAFTRNVPAVTSCIHAPTCKSSNGYSFSIPPFEYQTTFIFPLFNSLP